MSFSDSFINLNLMWVCHGTGYFETLIFPIPAVSTVHQRVLNISFVSVLFTTERHGPAGQGYCQGGFSADFTKVREIAVRLITQFLWLLSAAEVMLTFPCSVKCVCCRTAGLSSVDQAASTGKVRSWEHHTRGCSGVVTGVFFFLDLKKMKKPHGEKEEPLSEVTSMFLLQCPNSHKLCL